MSDFGFGGYNGFNDVDGNYGEDIGGMQIDNTMGMGAGYVDPYAQPMYDPAYNQQQMYDQSYMEPFTDLTAPMGGYTPMTGWNNGAGIYTPQTQFNFDNQQLLSLGFTQDEINTLLYIINCGGKATPAGLAQWGLPYEQARKLKYMYDIIVGKVSVESTDDLVKHLRRMFGQHRRVGLTDLKVTSINVLPRRCLIAGIPDKYPYAIYNSKNYAGAARAYEVIDIANKRILVKTKRKPQLKYGSSKKLMMVEDLESKTIKFVDDEKLLTKAEKETDRYIISNAVEIRRIMPNGDLEVAFDKRIARMMNRFIVVASLKKPEFHLWLYEIIAVEGTKIYVYAKTASSGDNVKYNGGTMRVYDYGFNASEIKAKTLNAATEVYNKICGVYATEEPGNCDFEPLEAPRKMKEAPPTDDTSEGSWD